MTVRSDGADLVGLLEALFANQARASYLGEPVTAAQHMLQAATRAEELGGDTELVLAALLHDVGHFLEPTTAGLVVVGSAGDGSTRPDRPAGHATDGSRWLARWFGPAVTEPIRLHVEAKRYLCGVEPDYHASLSVASVRSLRSQGGPMEDQEIRAFRAVPWAGDAVVLRRCDDWAKDPSRETRGLGHFLPSIRLLLP
ncbi:MAG TPA: HD domain-containing protein [Acidimicrobiales bacterium]|nr:HD domain-containing protein [Acidimicrobiales bacterium]